MKLLALLTAVSNFIDENACGKQVGSVLRGDPKEKSTLKK